MEYIDKFILIAGNTFNGLDLTMKLVLLRKYLRANYNECENHMTIANLISKIEVLVLKEFDSLTDEKFIEIKFERLLNELTFDGDKSLIQKN